MKTPGSAQKVRKSVPPVRRSHDRCRGRWGFLWIFLFVACWQLAFTWPWEVPRETKTSQKDESKAAPRTEKRPWWQQQTAKPKRGTDAGTRTEASAGGATAASLPHLNLPQIPKTYSPPVKIVRPYSVRKAPVDTGVTKIQQQIRDIIRLNETLKLRYKDQTNQLSRITEQARIHQQILNNLESEKTAAGGERDTEADLVRQEKIRLIEEETEKNFNFVSKLQSKRSK